VPNRFVYATVPPFADGGVNFFDVFDGGMRNFHYFCGNLDLMASDLELSLKRIVEKSRFLTERYKVVVDERDRAIAHARELQNALDAAQKDIQQLKMQVEYLTIAATIAPDRESLDAVRATISDLVRDIDRCICDLAE